MKHLIFFYYYLITKYICEMRVRINIKSNFQFKITFVKVKTVPSQNARLISPLSVASSNRPSVTLNPQELVV